jgi:hypothetical protein
MELDAVPDPVDDHGLTEKQAAFLMHYLANGFNGTKAYRAAFPNCSSDPVAATEAHRILKLEKMQAALKAERTARWKRLRMHGDEALALISLSARADIGLLYDEKGQLLPIRKWPRWMRTCVKSIKPGAEGPTIVLHDQLKARELMAVAAGKLKSTAVIEFDHARYLGAAPPTPAAATEEE